MVAALLCKGMDHHLQLIKRAHSYVYHYSQCAQSCPSLLQTMHAHSQFCWPGDHTLEATQLAVSEMSKEPADESFVIVLSDANFSRYRINPDKFATVMLADPRVNVFAVFIGSLGDQAQE